MSCTSATFCFAAGNYVDSGGSAQTLTEKWNGTAWSLVTSPNSSSTQANVLSGVSCTSSTVCIAVGDYVSAAGHAQTLTEKWNGSTWTRVTSPNDSTTRANVLTGVSCTSASFCFAAGDAVNAGGHAQTLTEKWNGSAWSVVASSNTSTTQANVIAGVSCTSATFCFADGDYINSGGHTQTLTEKWNGTAWSVVTSPNSSTQADALTGVSCTSSSVCSAVGDYASSTGTSQTLTDKWNGGTWSTVASPDN